MRVLATIATVLMALAAACKNAGQACNSNACCAGLSCVPTKRGNPPENKNGCFTMDGYAALADSKKVRMDLTDPTSDYYSWEAGQLSCSGTPGCNN